MVKTLIDIDQALMQRAMEVSGLPTKKAVVAMLLREYIREQALDRLVEYAKQGGFDDLSDPEVMAAAHK